MTKCARILIAVSFVLMSYQAFSQKKEANNGNSEQIKQEAVEMRNKVNKYMSEKLILNEAPSSASESLSNTIIQQRAEIDKLMERLQKLETLVNTQLINNSKKIDSHHYSEHATIDDLTDVVPGSYAYIGEKKLLLFYAFDSHRLNAQQIAAIKTFLYNKYTSSIQVNAFTDIFGSENYNNKLAANRSKAATKYIPGKKASINITPEAGCGLLNRIDSRKCRRVELILSN